MDFAFYQPLDHPFPLIATADIGRIAAEILIQQWEGDRFLELSGPASYSSTDVAAALEKALGSSIAGVAVPRETWDETMAQHGLAADRSGPYNEMLVELQLRLD